MEAASSPRPFVVVENGRPGAREAQAESLRHAGFDVTTCPGPRHLADVGCPLVATGDCALVAGADAVVYDLDLDNEEDREVLWVLRSRYPDVPVVLEIPNSVARWHRLLLLSCTVVPPYTPAQLRSAVEAAITAAQNSPGTKDATPPPAGFGQAGGRLVGRRLRQAAGGLRSLRRFFFPR